MSIALMSRAWELDIPQAEKFVLLCLCDFANDEGECWPAVARVAQKCSVGERTVQRSIRNLAAKGIVRIEEGGGRKNCNKYRIINLDYEPETPPESHPVTVTGKGENPVKYDINPATKSQNPATVAPEPSRTTIEPSGVKSETSSDDFSCDDFVESWNAVAVECGLPRLRKLTKARKQAFRVRKREYPDIGDWQSAFRCLRRTKWMHGDNDRGWRADADFFLTASKFTKLVEGSYAQAD